jgi:hypothetical protein
MTRTVQLFKKEILKGIQIDELKGFDINNLMSVVFQDQAFILEADLEKEKIAFKIPLTLENEFENQYRIDDLLISKVSIIGIYKGKQTGAAIKSNLLTSFSGKSSENTSGVKIIKDELENVKPVDDENEYHFIDIIGIIQDLNFAEPEVNYEWWQIKKKFIALLQKVAYFMKQI